MEKKAICITKQFAIWVTALMIMFAIRMPAQAAMTLRDAIGSIEKIQY